MKMVFDPSNKQIDIKLHNPNDYYRQAGENYPVIAIKVTFSTQIVSAIYQNYI